MIDNPVNFVTVTHGRNDVYVSIDRTYWKTTYRLGYELTFASARRLGRALDNAVRAGKFTVWMDIVEGVTFFNAVAP